MPAVKSLKTISEKWARQSQTAQPSYIEGIQNPRKDWADATAEANDNYKKGIQQSIAQDRFLKGVKKAGTSKWQRNAIAKGPGRWSEGIMQSTGAYEDGFQPYREVIERTQLPKRGPKGDPSNINRVAVMAKALHEEKIKRKS
jgi:hypothetical protein